MKYEDVFIGLKVTVTGESQYGKMFFKKLGIILDKKPFYGAKVRFNRIDGVLYTEAWLPLSALERYDENKFFNEKKIADDI